MRRHWHNRRTLLTALYFAGFLLPALLASIVRPFALWDYLTSADLLHFGRPIAWSALLSNLWHHLLVNTYIVRPTVSLLYDLQALLFGGEFWLWYAVKWAAFVACVLAVTTLLERLGCGWWARAAVASLLLFHPARFTLMLHAPDGWLALGMCGQLLLLAGCEFRLSRMGSGRQAFWLVAAFLTIGAKEAGYVFQGLLAAFLLLREPGAWLRLTPHAALLALWTWRLQAASGRASGFVLSEFLKRLGAHAELMLPATPWGLADLVLCGLAMYSAVIGWRQRRELSGQLIFFCWLTSVAVLGFVSAPKAIALRYVIPPVYLAAVPLGLALQQIPRGRAVVPGAFLALFPILMAGGIYRQELGYREHLDQTAELLRRMEGKARQGYVLAVSEAAADIDGEPLASIEAYFARYGPQWYGLPQKRELHRVRQQGWPAGGFAMASYLSPERVVKETGIDARRVQHVEALQAGDAGVLGKLTGGFLYLDRVLGRSGPYRTDTGAPEPATEPRFYLYTVGAAPQDAGWTQEAVPVSRPPGAF